MSRINFAGSAISLTLLASIMPVVSALSAAPALAMPSAQVENIARDLKATDEVAPTIGKALAFTKESQYTKEFSKACQSGKAAVDKALASKGDRALAIVSDLDETLLDNRPYFEGVKDKTADQIDWSAFEDWQKTSKAKSLKDTAELLSYARSKGVAIFFITGRMEHLRKATIQNLVGNGIAYDGLYMRADGDEQNASTMKSAYRKTIEDMGFTVVVNIGDQYSDLAGGLSVDCEKLPNKIYFIR